MGGVTEGLYAGVNPWGQRASFNYSKQVTQNRFYFSFHTNPFEQSDFWHNFYQSKQTGELPFRAQYSSGRQGLERDLLHREQAKSREHQCYGRHLETTRELMQII